MAQTKQKPKRTFTNTAGDTLRYFRNAPAAAPSSFMFRDTTRAPQPYQDMFTQAGGPPDMDSPWAPPYPQPQRPDAYSNMHAGRDGRQFAPEMMGDLSTETIQPQGGGDIGSPPRRPGDLALSPDWARNVRQGAEDFADDAWGMMKKGATNIGDYFQNAWRGVANREPGTNLTEDLVTGIPAAARGVYDAGKGAYDAATDTGNMRGPIGDMVNMAGDRMQQWNMERQGLNDRPEMQMRGMETPPLQMPEMQEQYMKEHRTGPRIYVDSRGESHTVGDFSDDESEKVYHNIIGQMAGQSRPDLVKNWNQGKRLGMEQEMARANEVSPMDALGAKMTMGARDAGSAIANVPRGAAEMAGRSLGGALNYGGSLVDAFKRGWMGEESPTAPKAQAQASPQTSQGIGPTKSGKTMGGKGGFKGAFAAARKANQKEFMYKGKKYNTRLKGQKAGAKKKPSNPSSGGQGGTSPFDYVGTMKRMFGK